MIPKGLHSGNFIVDYQHIQHTSSNEFQYELTSSESDDLLIRNKVR